MTITWLIKTKRWPALCRTKTSLHVWNVFDRLVAVWWLSVTIAGVDGNLPHSMLSQVMAESHCDRGDSIFTKHT